ncbi:MAG: hypothetical protein OSB21_05975, partial [Myxococcota bacterium]|nr:hypothetical protein [Myxococcota bacterium]
RHTCAVKTNGQVYCWGDNLAGQLGLQNVQQQTRPTTAWRDRYHEATLVGGPYNICALTGASLTCAGINTGYQLSPTGNLTEASYDYPALVLSEARLRDVAVGGSGHACVVNNSRHLSCWGTNSHRQAHASQTGGRSSRNTIATGMAAVALGHQHSCGLTTTGRVRCWGANQYGQTGQASRETPHGPTYVGGISNALKIAAAEFYTCALNNQNRVYCWGRNNYGQLGNGNTNDTHTPQRVQF